MFLRDEKRYNRGRASEKTKVTDRETVILRKMYGHGALPRLLGPWSRNRPDLTDACSEHLITPSCSYACLPPFPKRWRVTACWHEYLPPPPPPPCRSQALGVRARIKHACSLTIVSHWSSHLKNNKRHICIFYKCIWILLKLYTPLVIALYPWLYITF